MNSTALLQLQSGLYFIKYHQWLQCQIL